MNKELCLGNLKCSQENTESTQWNLNLFKGIRNRDYISWNVSHVPVIVNITYLFKASI